MYCISRDSYLSCHLNVLFLVPYMTLNPTRGLCEFTDQILTINDERLALVGSSFYVCRCARTSCCMRSLTLAIICGKTGEEAAVYIATSMIELLSSHA